MSNFVDYIVLKDEELPAVRPGHLYEYIFAANGMFVKGGNPYFDAVVPLKTFAYDRQYIRGLATVTPYVKLLVPKVPFYILQQILSVSRSVVPLECLFYVEMIGGEWRLVTPQQYQTQTSCKAKDAGRYVPIEVHSHNTMTAFFSRTDDGEETGLRIYGVVGHVDRPVADMRCRVSIYGHRAELPYHWIFEKYYEVQNV